MRQEIDQLRVYMKFDEGIFGESSDVGTVWNFGRSLRERECDIEREALMK